MPDWVSRDVIANGIKIHYYRTGDRKPPVVLLHGITDYGLYWSRVARGWRPTMISSWWMPGHAPRPYLTRSAPPRLSPLSSGR